MMIIGKASRRAVPSNGDGDDDGDDDDGGGDGATGECYLQWLIPTATVSFSAATYQHCMHLLSDFQSDKKGHHTTYYMKKSKGCICFEKYESSGPPVATPAHKQRYIPIDYFQTVTYYTGIERKL